MNASTLVKIHKEHASQPMAKGAKNTLCLLIASSLERGDIKSLVQIGISRHEAKRAIDYIRKRRKNEAS